MDYRLSRFRLEYPFTGIYHRPWSIDYRPTLLPKILTGRKVVSAIVLTSAAANVVCYMLTCLGVDVAYEGPGAIVAVGAAVAG